MVKKSNYLWFDKKILVVLIAFYIQNVTSLWGEENFFKKKSKNISRKVFFNEYKQRKLHAVH